MSLVFGQTMTAESPIMKQAIKAAQKTMKLTGRRLDVPRALPCSHIHTAFTMELKLQDTASDQNMSDNNLSGATSWIQSKLERLQLAGMP